MAKEIGTFEVWNHEKEKDNPFLLRIKEEDPKLWRDMKKYGRRNISLLTTAPAGSVSIETQTTSGIEPLFMTGYKRRKKINPNDENARTDFVDQSGDHWQEFMVYHPRVKDWMGITGLTDNDIEKSPWHGCCAEDLDWTQRVKLQAAAGRHVDHSISSTVNLPEDVTVEQVAEIYETAWEAGLKGITVYRKNCRTGVLVDDSKKESEKEELITKTTAPKRPKELPCEVHHAKVKGIDHFVIVGTFNGDPYEVFAGENGFIPRNIKDGVVRKVRRGSYEAMFEDGTRVENISEHITEDGEALTRLISASLRHGADVSFVVHQLEKVSGDMSSLAKAIGRVLKKNIKDGTKVHGDTCISCNGPNLQRRDGCVTCMDCGASACS
jgi:ribonucleoside-diphosphate reductase alpha chain